jgi:hypothetical protein
MAERKRRHRWVPLRDSTGREIGGTARLSFTLYADEEQPPCVPPNAQKDKS